jgi:flagellar basal body-associated protein FliL
VIKQATNATKYLHFRPFFHNFVSMKRYIFTIVAVIATLPLLFSCAEKEKEQQEQQEQEQQDKQYYHAVKHMATNIISNQSSKKNVLSKYGLKLDTLHESEIDGYIKEESIDDK